MNPKAIVPMKPPTHSNAPVNIFLYTLIHLITTLILLPIHDDSSFVNAPLPKCESEDFKYKSDGESHPGKQISISIY